MSFYLALEAAGLRPRLHDIVPDGRWRRCATHDKPKKKNGAFMLAIDGRRGWFRNWAEHDGVCEWGDDQATTMALSVETIRKAEEHRKRERARRIAAVKAARQYWAEQGPAGPNPYISELGLSMLGCSGLRQRGPRLIVPIVWRGHITSLQSINVRTGEKRFWPGASVAGGSFVIDRPRAAVTCICEGLRTGLAVYQAIPHARVVVAFDCGNLLPAVRNLPIAGSVVVCADNDRATAARIGRNPGIEKANQVAEALGCGVAYPQGIDGTDWADAFKEWGERAPSRIAREILAKARPIRPQEPTPKEST